MTYQSAPALRTALEHRLLERSTETGASLDRLRRRVMFERIIARMQAAEPGQWVLKGGMALEVRLRDDARLTKDVDLGLRDDVNSAPDLHERLIDILTVDLDHDYFIFTASSPERLRDDSGGVPTWRAKVNAQLADKPFGRIQLDVSPRTHELHATDRLAIPSSLAFAGIPTVEVEAVDIHRHAAEKFHGMLRAHHVPPRVATTAIARAKTTMRARLVSLVQLAAPQSFRTSAALDLNNTKTELETPCGIRTRK